MVDLLRQCLIDEGSIGGRSLSQIRQAMVGCYSAIALMTTLTFTIQYSMMYMIRSDDNIISMFGYAMLFDSLLCSIIALLTAIHM